MVKIVFIEGLPGSGKTTFSKRLKTYLSNQGKKVISYNEGDLHPVDLAWIAILTKKELSDLVTRYPSLKEAIFNHSKLINNRYFLAYTKVNIDESSQGFYEKCEKYEIYKKTDLDFFLQEHLDLWERFIEETSDNEFTYIFECILLQNHINELLLKYNLDLDEILAYYQKLLLRIKQLKVKLIYIRQVNIADIFSKIVKERVSDNKELYKDWIDLVIEYFEKTNYAKRKNYLGYHGALRYFEDRQNIELEIIKRLEIESKIVDLSDDYDDVFSKIVDEFI